MNLSGKTIVVGITGGIAAYKMCETVRLLVQAGATVRVVLTRAGAEFVTPLTLQTLSGNPVAHDTFDLSQESEIGHIRLADSAAALLIAPATANVIAKLAAGTADDLLTTVVLATRAPVLVAPAMNVHMYENPIVQQNIARLVETGRIIIEPDAGFLACGYQGVGRLPEPHVLVEELATAVSVKDLAGARVLVTAGPTWEAIDPIRHIANRSSGKMGYALAKLARRHGARVTLVSGPTALEAPRGVEVVPVTSARDMEEAVQRRAPASDVVIMAAAVGDYRPATQARHKIKRDKSSLQLRLVQNPDILGSLRARCRQCVLVGFAAETRNLTANARQKLRVKSLDLIVANDVGAEGAGFDVETNVVTLIGRSGRIERLPKMAKDDVAAAILDRVCTLRASRRTLAKKVRPGRRRS